jgi:chorismate-pyruvate lyase
LAKENYMRPHDRKSGWRVALVMLLASTPALDAPVATVWPDTQIARLAALALLETLNAQLLSHDSATATLSDWCAAHQLAAAATIVADRIETTPPELPADTRERLRVEPKQTVQYRHVRLRCGEHVLSEADNWYVPDRLTGQMNDTLQHTDTPFGRVVQPLHFQRHTLSAQLLWRPLPEGWEMQRMAGARAPSRRSAPLQIPPGVLEHRALLTLPDGTPFSEVTETYTREVLAFSPPL